MKSVLLTGSSGFIGKNLLKTLVKDKFNVHAYSSKNLDLTNENDVDLIFKNQQFDCVIHLAADVGGIEYIKSNQGKILYNNLMMNTILMEKSRIYDVKKFISLNTINSYPESNKALKENQVWDGSPNPDIFSYGISKRILLAQSRAYRLQYDFKSYNLIIDNTYGPDDNFNPKVSRVIPALISKFNDAVSKNSPFVNIWGSGKSIRQFLYVEDLVEIIKYVVKNDVKYETINISNGETLKISDLVNHISDLFKFKGQIKYDISMPEGAAKRLMDNSRMIESINYTDFHFIKDGLSKTVNWFINNYETARK